MARMAVSWDKVIHRWFRRRGDQEPEFPIPPVRADKGVPPAVLRHLQIIHDAMLSGDTKTVGNRQLRLLKLGIEVPTKLSHVKDMMERYGVTESSN